VDRKSRKADLLASKQNKKVKGEFEILDPIDAQMEATVQEMRQNVINIFWDVIAEAHKIVDMSMYIKRFVASNFLTCWTMTTQMTQLLRRSVMMMMTTTTRHI
jgi:hypothetical protein